ncbi:hypothetical protein [Campylobacter devanensis]|uniref:hypothetical protein n=1 Tax=Campylobacter devanensis TaxID=3161138 RepID=UPI000A345C34|nr:MULTISPECIES: hypothetical protein [unclassified Campylobacter]
MRLIILVSLLCLMLNGFEAAQKNTPVNLASKLSKGSFDIQTCKLLTSHYKELHGNTQILNSIDLINIEAIKFDHWTTRDFSINIFQAVNTHTKNYNFYGIYTASHDLNLDIFKLTNSLNTTYDDSLDIPTAYMHSTNLSAKLLKNTKIGAMLYQDETKQYNTNYYINTKIYKNLYLDLSFYNTQSTNNFYTKFTLNY